MMTAMELFVGAGGLGMGIALAGFKSTSAIEWDKWACDTIRENQNRDHPLVRSWPVVEGDVQAFHFEDFKGKVDLLAGGPPCQPFSQGGRHRANLDKRDMFPAMIEAIRTTLPPAFIVENVKGLTRKTFGNYFEYIRYQLKHPTVVREKSESWEDHRERLQKLDSSGYRDHTSYQLMFQVLNAADYGVPQRRERVFLVGLRHDLHVKWAFPRETHSLDALLYSQYVTGEYWDRHRVARKDRLEVPSRMKGRVEQVRSERPLERPWLTVRDALIGMPDPEHGGDGGFLNHTFQPGAKVYPGHTGSPVDLPAKTLKAGVHGVPGGENMLVNSDGSVRYFTVREAARLQTFPDTFIFHGAWSEVMRQLGNAVPVSLAHTVASSVAARLLEAQERQLRETIQGREKVQ
jgi:DNA (cytosine-5)-methyltransferase 1